jgi:hypothetical protein
MSGLLKEAGTQGINLNNVVDVVVVNVEEENGEVVKVEVAHVAATEVEGVEKGARPMVRGEARGEEVREDEEGVSIVSLPLLFEVSECGTWHVWR